MNKQRCILKRGTAILVLTVSAIVLLPTVLFAKGDVVGYAPEYKNPPSNEQLDRLTHVIVFSVYPDASGNLLNKSALENNTWLSSNANSLLKRAQAKGVKVSISVGGGGDVRSEHFKTATNSANLAYFVANIVSFVTTHDLDGVDINWEYPSNATEWGQCIALLTDLRTALGTCKRISIALRLGSPAWTFPNQTIPQQIWTAVDAIHLMTYDAAYPDWPSHSNAAKAIDAIDAWATWGTTGGRNLDKEKLHIGCAFYGYNYERDGQGNIEYDQWGRKFDWTGVAYNEPNYSTCENKGDNTTSVADKVNHCYDNGYGGVFIWELAQDKNITTTPELLNAIWAATSAKVITINTHPAASITVVQGNICGSLSVSASANASLTYQWYSNTTNNNSGGTPISSATNASFTIPTSLTAGTYYYFCEIKSGKYIVRSNVATVTVTAPITPPVISGPASAKCKAKNLTYSIPQITGATYLWDGGILEPSGSNTGYSVKFDAPNVIYSWETETTVSCMITLNGCSFWVYKTVSLISCAISPSNIYPNPVSNILNIEIDTEIYDNTRGIKTNPTFDIRLYDGMGNALRQTTTKSNSVQFNVSNLPNGTYYLHIYDGVSNMPEVQQIIVQH